MSAPSKRPPPSRRTRRAKRLRPAQREQRANYLRTLPDLSAPELELVLELWDDLGDDMRGVRIRWMQPEPVPPPPRRLHVAPLLSVPPLPEGCAVEADDAFVTERVPALPMVFDLDSGIGEPPADLDWADLAGDEEWVDVRASDDSPSAPEQGWLF